MIGGQALSLPWDGSAAGTAAGPATPAARAAATGLTGLQLRSAPTSPVPTLDSLTDSKQQPPSLLQLHSPSLLHWREQSSPRWDGLENKRSPVALPVTVQTLHVVQQNVVLRRSAHFIQECPCSHFCRATREAHVQTPTYL